MSVPEEDGADEVVRQAAEAIGDAYRSTADEAANAAWQALIEKGTSERPPLTGNLVDSRVAVSAALRLARALRSSRWRRRPATAELRTVHGESLDGADRATVVNAFFDALRAAERSTLAGTVAALDDEASSLLDYGLDQGRRWRERVGDAGFWGGDSAQVNPQHTAPYEVVAGQRMRASHGRIMEPASSDQNLGDPADAMPWRDDLERLGTVVDELRGTSDEPPLFTRTDDHDGLDDTQPTTELDRGPDGDVGRNDDLGDDPGRQPGPGGLI